MRWIRDLEIGDIQRYETEMLSFMRENHGAVLNLCCTVLAGAVVGKCLRMRDACLEGLSRGLRLFARLFSRRLCRSSSSLQPSLPTFPSIFPIIFADFPIFPNFRVHVFSSYKKHLYKKRLVDLSGWKKRRLDDILIAKKHESYFFSNFSI